MFTANKIRGTNYESKIFLFWRDKKTMVFKDDKGELEASGWTSLKVGEIKVGKFAELF